MNSTDVSDDEVVLPTSPAEKVFIFCLSLWGCAIWTAIGWVIYIKVTS